VTLSWAAASGASSYDIKRSTTSGGPYDLISADPTTPAYADGSVNNGMIYYFAVSAVNSAGESANSAEVSARSVSSVPPQLNFLLNGNILQFDWLARSHRC
jgi:fibronectin type 3 domain-containing protein